MDSPSPKKYWAFISYSSKDKKWGQWLHKRLERYPIPKELQGTTLFDGAVLGKNLSPVFRDRDELSGSAELGPALEKALRSSRYLVVLCSTNSAKSTWVDKEIEDFKAMGGERNILALILDGEPNSGGADECFPPALRYPTEPLAGDLRRDGDGKERGLLKIVAGAAQLDFDSLYRRHERAQRKKRLTLGALALGVIASLAGLTLYAFQQRSEARTNAAAATAARAVAERNEQRATGLLVSSYTERGRQAFLDGSFAEALTFFNQARQIDPHTTGTEPMIADAWRRLSPLKGEISGEQKEISHLQFSADGTTLATQDAHGAVRTFALNPRNRTLASHRFIGFMPHPLVFPTTPYLVGYFKETDPANPDYLLREIRRVDWHRGKQSGSIPWPKDRSDPTLIVASPGGTRLATYSESFGNESNDIVRLWKFEEEEATESRFELPESPRNFHWFFSADERTLVQLRFTGDSFDLTLRESSTGKILQQFPLNSRPEAHASFADRICIGLFNGELIEFRRKDDTFTRRTPSAGQISQFGTLQYSADGRQLLAGGTMGNVFLYNTEDLSVALNIDRQRLGGVAKHTALSGKGRFLSVTQGDQVSVFDTSTGELHGHYSWTGSDASTATFSDDESLLAAGTDNGNIRIWSLERKSPWHREFQASGESNLASIRPIQGDQHLLRGQASHLLDLSTDTLDPVPDKHKGAVAFSPDRTLLELGDGAISLSIKNAKTGDTLATPWNVGAKNVFLPPGSPAAGVIVQLNGIAQAYTSAPAFLPVALPAKQSLGSPQSLIIAEENLLCCASFSNGSILEFTVAESGVQDPQLHQVPGSEKAPPILHELRRNKLLLTLNGQLAVYDLSTRALVTLPRLNLRAGTFLRSADQLSVLSIDAFGKLELWNEQGEPLANASSPVQQASGTPLLGKRKIAGSSILLNRKANTAYTTFGDQLYLWSLPDLSLTWRSPEIPTMGESLTLRGLSEDESRIILTDQSPFGGQSFTKIHTITPPTAVPGIEEASTYLSDVTGIKIVEGRIIRD